MTMTTLPLFLLVAFTICTNTGEGRTVVRLVGGVYPWEGRVELVSPWLGTVCDDAWDVNDAKVICRMLGFDPTAISPNALGGAYYGAGSLDIVLDDVACKGTESDILNCRSSSAHDCDHSEDAGVNCYPGFVQVPIPCPEHMCPNAELSCPSCPNVNLSCPRLTIPDNMLNQSASVPLLGIEKTLSLAIGATQIGGLIVNIALLCVVTALICHLRNANQGRLDVNQPPSRVAVNERVEMNRYVSEGATGTMCQDTTNDGQIYEECG